MTSQATLTQPESPLVRRDRYLRQQISLAIQAGRWQFVAMLERKADRLACQIAREDVMSGAGWTTLSTPTQER